MKVYVLINSNDGEAIVDVFADKEEAILTAGLRAQRGYNRHRAPEEKLTPYDIAVLGATIGDDVKGFGLTAGMIASDWVWYCHTYDDGDTFRIVETTLIK